MATASHFYRPDFVSGYHSLTSSDSFRFIFQAHFFNSYFGHSVLAVPAEALAKAGAEEGTRTPKRFLSQPPQGCVSTSFTTSANALDILTKTTIFSTKKEDF
jgi:hypothetical protein